MLNLNAAAPELLRRLQQLDAPLSPPVSRQLPAPDAQAPVDFDVALAGGGLSLLFAPLLAARGLRVVVLERERAGTAQREWNASRRELSALEEVGLCDAATVDGLIVNRYRHGICRWHEGGSYPVKGVLDCAVDATALLQLARSRAEALGVVFMDNATCLGEAAGPQSVRTVGMHNDKPFTLTTRLFLDGRGARSPYAKTDLLCPTVGGVLEGLEEGDDDARVDPTVGEILATTDDVEDGRQYVWEVFPGRPGQTTVYLFYYAQTQSVGPGALQALYARFAARLPHFKRGDAKLVRPTFGYIPGWSRLGPGPTSPDARIMLVGDAASRHSPLTFCGFGAMLRSLSPVLAAVQNAMAGDLRRASVVDDRPLHSATGALARMMASPPADAHAVNALLDAAFATLHSMGDERYAALLQDTLPLPDFVRFLRTTSLRRPSVYRDVWQSLGVRTTARWSLQVARAWLRDNPAAPC